MPPTFNDHSQGSFDAKPSMKIVNTTNVAVTARFAVIVRSQSPLPEQEPLQRTEEPRGSEEGLSVSGSQWS